MAYDVASYYANSLSNGSSLSKSILDMLMANNKFNDSSKITLPFNYGSGDVTRTIIGYDEVGNPIYETSSLTMNDDMKSAIAKMHDRNSDTMLKGPGINSIENTSTGNIVQFISNGRVKAIITEDGRFTGKIRLDNIENLNELTLNTSNFYNKSDVNNLLKGKINKADIFSSNGKLQSDLLDVDIVRKVELNDHTTNTVTHTNNNEKEKWDAKYDKPSMGIPIDHLNSSLQNLINNAATQADLETHVSDSTIHVTTSNKSSWDAKYDKPTTGIPKYDLSEMVQNVIDNAVDTKTFLAHNSNDVIHINASERSNWNSKYDKPKAGIPENDLDTPLKDKLSSFATRIELINHQDNTTNHITSQERSNWNSKYDLLPAGIPIKHLSTEITDLISSKATNEDLLHHSSDIKLHISDIERSKWNAKYDKPSTGIPESDLDSTLKNKIDGSITSTDFNDHATDSTKHITSQERVNWNAKYDLLPTGIPESDLNSNIVSKLKDSFDHIANNDIHVTKVKTDSWDAKYDKPENGIDESDLNSNIVSKLKDSVSHITDSDIHVTSENKTSWNSKYDKPENGIPESDLVSDVTTKLSNSVDHIANNEIHVTKVKTDVWDAKYDKPENGIPESDLVSNVTDKLSNSVSHITDSTIHVTKVKTDSWDAKYDKPENGIDESDLNSNITTKLSNSVDHISNNEIHVTKAKTDAWDALLTKKITMDDLSDELKAILAKVTENHPNIENP